MECTQDAIEAYRVYYAKEKQPIDLVITDLNMPIKLGTSPVDEAGIVLTRTIHKIHSTVPIVVLTGLKNQDVLTRAMKAGAVGFIPKSEFTSHTSFVKSLKRFLPAELLFK